MSTYRNSLNADWQTLSGRTSRTVHRVLKGDVTGGGSRGHGGARNDRRRLGLLVECLTAYPLTRGGPGVGGGSDDGRCSVPDVWH